MFVCILGDSEVAVWGLGGRERLERMVRAAGGATLIDAVAALPPDKTVLLIRGDYVFDHRLFAALLGGTADLALRVPGDPRTPALRIRADRAGAALALLREDPCAIPEGVEHCTAEQLVPDYDQRLLKRARATATPIEAGSRRQLEDRLFGGSYKGVTDFVTKFVWPKPALLVTRCCARMHLHPNHVTGTGLLLAVLAGIAFWHGHLGIGLAAGWLMTFLDTVDGKLARVTVSSSRFGDRLDHGIDLIHPPLWYLAWGMGIADTWRASLSTESVFWLILAAYVGGRLCEGGFQRWVAPFKLFLWRPLDSINRLITARRNPNMVLLTLSYLWGRPDVGLLAVLLWHVLSTLFLLARCITGWRIKRRGGRLQSWLEAVDAEVGAAHLAARLFTRGSS